MLAPRIRNSEFFTIQFKHIPTGRKTSFEGWVTTFSDNFSSQWNEIPVYGRMDPLATFTRTSRKIQLAFDVPSENLASAQTNLQAVNDLITFLYPVYEKQDGSGNQRVGHTLKAAPLIELKWTNLIADASDNSGLIGYLDGVNYAPKVEEGGFGRPAGGNYHENWSNTSFEVLREASALRQADVRQLTMPGEGTRTTQIGSVDKTDIYIPKTLSINLNFTVLHKHLPGWVITTSTDADDSVIFGNPQVNGGFPNTQIGIRSGAVRTSFTNTFTDKDGNVVAQTGVTNILSSFGSEMLGDFEGVSGGILVEESSSEL